MSKLRVSCVAFCRIRHQDHYLFLLNIARARRGFYTATPLGGAITYRNPSFLKAFNAEPEKPGTQDLRFYIDKAGADFKLTALRRWLAQRAERGADAFREMREELVDEMGILPGLTRADVSVKFAGAIEEQLESNRPDARVRDTYYFREIYDVQILNAELKSRLLNSDPGFGAFWLTLEDAARGGPVRWQGQDVSIHLAHVLKVGQRPRPSNPTPPAGVRAVLFRS